MTDERFQAITPATREDYQQLVAPLADACWPEFMLHDPITDLYWGALFEHFSEYQFGLLDTQTGKAAAMGNSMPLHWDGDPADLPEGGFDWVMQQSVADHQGALQPRTQCAIQIAIHPDHQGVGLSTRMLQMMRSIGISKGFKRLLAPIRPSQKHQYPLASIDNYIHWKNDAGLPLDAWMRVHVRLGAQVIKPCHESMDIRGTIADWERWTGMKFLESGEYIVPGALNPIKVDLESDQAIYIEPNIWLVHPLD